MSDKKARQQKGLKIFISIILLRDKFQKIFYP